MLSGGGKEVGRGRSPGVKGCGRTGVNGKGSVMWAGESGKGRGMAHTLNYPNYAISIPDKHTYFKYFSQRGGGGSISEVLLSI